MAEKYPMTGAYAPTATCKHGDHPYDCRQGCDPHEHARYYHLHDRIRELETALRNIATNKLTSSTRPGSLYQAGVRAGLAIAADMARKALASGATTASDRGGKHE